MKATGIVRQLDGLGRVVLPKSLRHTLNIAEGDGLEIFVEGEKIILRKYTLMDAACAAMWSANL